MGSSTSGIYANFPEAQLKNRTTIPGYLRQFVFIRGCKL